MGGSLAGRGRVGNSHLALNPKQTISASVAWIWCTIDRGRGLSAIVRLIFLKNDGAAA